MNHIYTPGPGDSATWPACSGHPLDPRSIDDDGALHDESSALEAATDDVLATPYSWSWFLMQAVEQTEPVKTCVHKAEWFAGDATVDELLAIVMNCSDLDIVREARAELRDRFLAHQDTQQTLRDRAAALVGEPA